MQPLVLKLNDPKSSYGHSKLCVPPTKIPHLVDEYVLLEIEHLLSCRLAAIVREKCLKGMSCLGESVKREGVASQRKVDVVLKGKKERGDDQCINYTHKLTK